MSWGSPRQKGLQYNTVGFMTKRRKAPKQVEPEDNSHVAVRISLKFVTARKKRKIAAFLEAYCPTVNFFIRQVWPLKGGKGVHFNGATLALLPKNKTRLSERYKSQALKQAVDICYSTIRSAEELGVKPSMPVFQNGGAKLDAKFVKVIEREGESIFDLSILLSEMEGIRGKRRMFLPLKRTEVFNKWKEWQQKVDVPNQKEPVVYKADLVQGCELTKEYVILWFKIPEMPYRKSRMIGVDIGKNKMVATSCGDFFGEEYSEICDAVSRKKRGSRSRKRAARRRDQYINKVVKELPWDSIGVIGIEDLTGMKTGKSKGRGKNFRKAMASWKYCQPINRMIQLAKVNRVRPWFVDPANSSRTCPDCGTVSKLSRRGENFDCIACDYTGDADHIGAIEILARTRDDLRSLESRSA